MNVSIFGGSGFIGYDFVKHILNADISITPTIYSTNAGSLTNLSRYDLDIRLVRYSQLDEIQLPQDTDYLINFMHPFGIRDNLTPKKQISSLLSFVRKQLQLRPNLKFIHISTMSVYEPFSENHLYAEDEVSDPPKSDVYANSKTKIDKEILSWTPMLDRIQLLRPTVVYGPFGIPWTDNIFKQLIAGPLTHYGLQGRIQPIWVSDISRFLMLNLHLFNSGTYNIAGPEICSWKKFLEYFSEIAEVEQLVQIPFSEGKPNSLKGQPADVIHTFKKWFHSSFVKEVATPFFRRLPDAIKNPIKGTLLPNRHAPTGNLNAEQPGPYCRNFFEEDRLLSIDKITKEFPEFALTSLRSTHDTMRDYFKFRFTDNL